jgi:hypothetical protein
MGSIAMSGEKYAPVWARFPTGRRIEKKRIETRTRLFFMFSG